MKPGASATVEPKTDGRDSADPKRSVLILSVTLITGGQIAASNVRTYAGLPPEGVLAVERRLVEMDLSLLSLGHEVAGVPESAGDEASAS